MKEDKKPSELGVQIFELRKRYGLSQRKLADLMGCSSAHISSIERGKAQPDSKFTRRLYNVLPRTEAERERFVEAILLAFVGEDVPWQWIPEKPRTIDLSEAYHHDLWVITDYFRELFDEVYFNNACRAITAGLSRTYFISMRRVSRQKVAQLVSRFVEKIGADSVKDRVRFYEIPRWVAHFRITIIDPRFHYFGASAEHGVIVVEGEEAIIPRSHLDGIVTGLKWAMSQLEFGSEEQLLGLRRIDFLI